MIGNTKAIIEWLFEQDTTKKFEIKELKPKRSLTANAYYWALLNQLANVLRFDNQKLHFMMLQRYGQYEVVSVLSSIKEFSILLDGLVSECNEQSIATLTKSEREQLHFIEGCD